MVKEMLNTLNIASVSVNQHKEIFVLLVFFLCDSLSLSKKIEISRFSRFGGIAVVSIKSLKKDDDDQKTETQKRVTEILSRLESIRQE